MKRDIILALYLILIVLGGLFIVAARDDPQVNLVAKQKLPANHLLRPGDLSLHTDGRQYITRPVERGEVIEFNEIVSAPRPGAIKVPVSLLAERDRVDSGDIDIGKLFFVCPPKVKAEVRAVFCGNGGLACIAIVEVAETDAEKVTADKTAELSLQNVCG